MSCHMPVRGIQPTMQAIEIYFYWPHMQQKDIKDYVSKCIVCQKVKYERGKAPGLLQPLPILDLPWQSISMDFVFGLPKSTQGNNGIWTIVDCFSNKHTSCLLRRLLQQRTWPHYSFPKYLNTMVCHLLLNLIETLE